MAASSPLSSGQTVAALLALTAVTGLVDAVSYLRLGRVFVANMTGNVVFLGSSADRPPARFDHHPGHRPGGGAGTVAGPAGGEPGWLSAAVRGAGPVTCGGRQERAENQVSSGEAVAKLVALVPASLPSEVMSHALAQRDRRQDRRPSQTRRPRQTPRPAQARRPSHDRRAS